LFFSPRPLADFFTKDLIISAQREPIPSSLMILCIISTQGDPSKQVLTFPGWSLFSFISLALSLFSFAESVPRLSR